LGIVFKGENLKVEKERILLTLKENNAVITINEILPESICGEDDRNEVENTGTTPYSWICQLFITTADGITVRGSGWQINIPDVENRVIVTSAHCTYQHDHGGYANDIEVRFPGQAPIHATTFRASEEWIKAKNSDHDYGVILLPGDPGGFGWNSGFRDNELTNREVFTCGYPGDKPVGTQWESDGNITKISEERIFYMNDSMPGHSGSPLWTQWNNSIYATGVHSYGGCPNSSIRITIRVIRQILEWAGHPNIDHAIKSIAFPNVFLRMDGRSVTSFQGEGSGVVNCQYGAYEWEKYDIIPVFMPPSTITQDPDSIPYVIVSRSFPNVFLRMDGRSVTSFQGEGSGVVNCQFGAYEWEHYNLIRERDNVSIRSVSFPNVFLHIYMDEKSVTSFQDEGSRVVNCQFGASDWEKFKLT